MKPFLCVLLVFYFVLTAGEGRGRVVGPFADFATCQQVARLISWASPCWEGK